MFWRLYYNLHRCCKSDSTFTITERNLYVTVVILSTQDNAKLLSKLGSGFLATISCNKHLSKPELLTRNPDLNSLVEPSFQRANILFALTFENNTQRTSNKRYYLPHVEIKIYNVMTAVKKPLWSTNKK